MVGSLLRLTTCAEELAEAHVTVGDVGVLVEEALTQSLGLVELPGVNQVNDAVGELVELLAVIVDHRAPAGAGLVDRRRRGVAALLLAGSDSGSLVGS